MRNISEDVLEINETPEFKVNFVKDIQNGGINTVTWEDISDAIKK